MPLRALRSHPFPLFRLPGLVLVALACAVALTLTVGLSVLFAWRDRDASFREAASLAGNVSLLVAEHAARLLETGDIILKQAALAGAAGGRDDWERLSALAGSSAHLMSVWLTDAEGRAVRDTLPLPAARLDEAGRAALQAHREGWNGLLVSRFDGGGGPLILLSRPLAAAPGEIRGAAVAALPPRPFSDVYRAFDIGYARTITLRTAGGRVLLRESEGGNGAATPPEEAITVRRPVEGTDLVAEVAIPISSVLAHWHRRLWAYAAYALAATAAIVVIGGLALERSRRERKAEEALQHAYDTLEENVHRRTAELEQANAQLAAALADKEVLLKEVQHRVKNNLQVISSLLRLQAGRIDERARRGFDQSLRRIQSMSLLHELLYRSDQPARINLAAYLRQLGDGLVRSGNPTGARLAIEAEDWTVDVDQATPLALIASELLSNALLHAFPDGHPGTVTLELRREAGGMRMSVRDDGVGLPADLPGPQRRKGGLGLVLVQALAQQAGAVLRIDRDRGTAFVLTIPTAGGRRSQAA